MALIAWKGKIAVHVTFFIETSLAYMLLSSMNRKAIISAAAYSHYLLLLTRFDKTADPWREY